MDDAGRKRRPPRSVRRAALHARVRACAAAVDQAVWSAIENVAA